MKASSKFVLYSLFTALYACSFSLGMTCLLQLLGVALGVAIDGSAVIRQYPRLIPFCFIVGFVCLTALIALAFLNAKFSKKLNYTKAVWIIQFICAFAASIPMIMLWERLFEFLQKVF